MPYTKEIPNNTASIIFQLLIKLGYKYGIWWNSDRNAPGTKNSFYWLPRFFKTEQEAVRFLKHFSGSYTLHHHWLDYHGEYSTCKANALRIDDYTNIFNSDTILHFEESALPHERGC